MTFSTETKNTICKNEAETWCCKQKELAALVCFAGNVNKKKIRINSENKNIADRICALIREVTLTDEVVLEAPRKSGGWYTVTVQGDAVLDRMLQALEVSEELVPKFSEIELECCRASFLRGAFLGGGSVADPEKNYHIEFVTANSKTADFLTELIAACGYLAGLTVRKNHFVIYIKDSEAIAELLGYMGAGTTMMNFYNIKIERELRNQVNRQVNCDSANLNKTMDAAQKQIEAIQKIDRTIGLEALPPQLYEMAQVRLDNPELSLKDLAMTLSPPIGKSGANHRLTKLIEIADSL